MMARVNRTTRLARSRNCGHHMSTGWTRAYKSRIKRAHWKRPPNFSSSEKQHLQNYTLTETQALVQQITMKLAKLRAIPDFLPDVEIVNEKSD